MQPIASVVFADLRARQIEQHEEERTEKPTTGSPRSLSLLWPAETYGNSSAGVNMSR
jgi:hypothetical protein